MDSKEMTCNHEYVITNAYTGGTDYECKLCGHKKTESTLPKVQDTASSSDSANAGYVLLDPNRTSILYSDTLRLTIESTGKEVRFNKQVVHVGKDASCDFLLNSKATISRRHATFFYERNMWFLLDNFSTNGTWLNGARIEPGKKYQLATNDEINFAMAEKAIFDKHIIPSVPSGDPDAKALVFLEAGMAAFAKSNYQDEAALKLIVAALVDAPLHFPVEIDLEAMLGNIDPTKLKVGNTIQPQKDVRVRILTLAPKDGVETVPMFTSTEEANKGPSASMMRFYPQDYLPKLIAMDKPVIINPFSDSRFLLSKQIITEIVWPAVQRKVGAENSVSQMKNEETTVLDDLVGKTIWNRYKVLKLIGQGGFFSTYLVMDEKLNKQWAMKVCDKNHKRYSRPIHGIFLQEPKMMMKLDHPAIPKIMDIFEDKNYICVVREYIAGETLDVVVRNKGPIKQEFVVDWAKQLCGVLSCLHNQKPSYVYRDMKPANVVLQPDGNVKLIDFGIAMEYDPSKQDDTIIGTCGYAAPEQFVGKSDCRTDIFALGMTMHYLLTGADPNAPPYETKPIREINPQLSSRLEAIIMRCIRPNPDERFQSCDELMMALEGNPVSPQKKPSLFNKLFGKK